MADRSSNRAPAEDAFPEGLPRGEILNDKYLIEEVVGAGGMGIVLAAQHLQLGQRVAIKLLLAKDMDAAERADARVRFLREAQAAARLASDHVVRIHDVGTLESGAPFMVMELLRGRDLSRTLDEEGPLPVDLAVDYVIQACDAVGEAHAHGIVHRDLKPSNLFICRKPDGRENVKVLDFGISKSVAAEGKSLELSLTSTRSVIGSPHYMSPEQVRDAKRVDARSDIWALGAILYECLVGDPAFDADTLPGICAAIAADTPVPLRQRRPDVPEALESVVMRCLEKDPSRRLQSVYELVNALLPFAEHDVGPRHQHVVLPATAPANKMALSTTVVLPNKEPPATAPSVEPKPSRGATVALALAAAASLVLGFVFYRGAAREQPSAPPVAMQAAPAASPAAFVLRLESNPRRAVVTEGGLVLGTTPLEISVDRTSVAGASRRFVLELPGHIPYVVTQGASASDIRVMAVLEPEPPPAPAAPARAVEPPAEPATPFTAPRSGKSRAARPAKAAPEPSAESDIRLQR